MSFYGVELSRSPDQRNPKLVPRRSLLRRCAKFEKERGEERRMLIGDVTAHLRPQTPCTENTIDQADNTSTSLWKKWLNLDGNLMPATNNVAPQITSTTNKLIKSPMKLKLILIKFFRLGERRLFPNHTAGRSNSNVYQVYII